MQQIIGKYLVILGIVLIIIGGLVFFGGKLPWLGRLPGDIFIKRGNFSFYFPISTSILISVILSLIFYLLFRK